MAEAENYREVACVDETHYLHLGDNADGQPCNSSINPAAWDGDTDDWGEPLRGWRCIGCGMHWETMPDMEHEGLSALRHMRERDDG